MTLTRGFWVFPNFWAIRQPSRYHHTPDCTYSITPLSSQSAFCCPCNQHDGVAPTDPCDKQTFCMFCTGASLRSSGMLHQWVHGFLTGNCFGIFLPAQYVSASPTRWDSRYNEYSKIIYNSNKIIYLHAFKTRIMSSLSDVWATFSENFSAISHPLFATSLVSMLVGYIWRFWFYQDNFFLYDNYLPHPTRAIPLTITTSRTINLPTWLITPLVNYNLSNTLSFKSSS